MQTVIPKEGADTVLKRDTVNYFDPATGQPAQREAIIEVREYPVEDKIVKVGQGKAVTIQIGPTPCNAFAVFAKNEAFHEEAPEVWDRAARQALEVWAGRGNRTVARITNEHGRPMNLRMEYS